MCLSAGNALPISSWKLVSILDSVPQEIVCIKTVGHAKFNVPCQNNWGFRFDPLVGLLKVCGLLFIHIIIKAKAPFMSWLYLL